MSVYAGIGSRQTPEVVQVLMADLAGFYARNQYTLRSGGAQGADQAFERGCDLYNGPKEIFTSDSTHIDQEWVHKLVWDFHPNPYALKGRSFRLMARNGLQVFGADGQTPVQFIFCWTPGGKISGGTGQALRIARQYAIPVYNLGDPSTFDWIHHKLTANV